MDRRFRLARVWSNKELKKFSHLFTGDIVNVSAWKDKDKQGLTYKDYFINANKYFITNYNDVKGVQSLPNEIFLDLEDDLPRNLHKRFDVVFSHTVLEHVFDFKKAFDNLCFLTKDIVIIVIPFSHVNHGGKIPDYWRFTPQSITKMFINNGFDVIYSSSNRNFNSAIYLFFIATRDVSKWKNFNRVIIENYDYVGDLIGFKFPMFFFKTYKMFSSLIFRRSD
jgi:hypothetical protein